MNMLKSLAYWILTSWLVIAALWSIYLDSNVLLSATELPSEQWKYVWWDFSRVALYNLTLTGSITYTAYRSVRLLCQTIRG